MAQSGSAMEVPADFTAPEDFLGDGRTPLATVLSDMDRVTRCMICGEFYTQPTITACSHTYCALCIRQAATNTGVCPTDGKKIDKSALRKNWVVTEVVARWKECRPQLLALIERAKTLEAKLLEAHEPMSNSEPAAANTEPALPTSTESSGRKKRQFDQVDPKNAAQPRRLRSFGPDKPSIYYKEVNGESVLHESDDEHMPDVLDPPLEDKFDPAKATAACPCCNERMKPEEVFDHLDFCEANGKAPRPALPPPASHAQPSYHALSKQTAAGSSRQSQSSNTAPLTAPGNSTKRRRIAASPPRLQPIGQLNYNLLTLPSLRKKLNELGIHSNGSKQLLERRHRYYVDLYNTNVDADEPRKPKDLMRDMEVWERTQGGMAKSKPNEVMQKDFNRDNYSAANNNQFKDLISQARAKMAATKQPKAETRPPENIPESSTPPGTPQVAPGYLGISNGTGSGSTHVNSSHKEQQQRETTPAKAMFISAVETTNNDLYAPRSPRAQQQQQQQQWTNNYPPSSQQARSIPMFQLPGDPIKDFDYSTETK
ncbi:DNA repair protein rad18 [Microthyrium microscopicum]|uniref:Postreplication repair E3 ubiquitin-protein ligase RAD18 n=1 Tax=Microthyrium microscopicum TaxID=703497 RepID=A0A6A6TZV9_9PEZI|nr:DNA repair protein rad18 [Microthyrium microscopicum]